MAGQISEGTDIPNEIAKALKESEEDTDELPASELDVGHSDATDSAADRSEASDEPVQGEELPSEESEGVEEFQARFVVEADEPESIGKPRDSAEDPSADKGHGDSIPTTPKTPARTRSNADVSLDYDTVIGHGVEDGVMALTSKSELDSPGSQSTCQDASAAELQEDVVFETETLDKRNSENIDQSSPTDTFSAMSVRVVNQQASELNFAASNGESEIVEPQTSGSPGLGSPARDGANADLTLEVEILAPLTSESSFSRHHPGASPTKSQVTEAVQLEPEASTAVPDTNPSAGDANQPNEAPTLPQSRTRSGTRFSDDTTLLKDFLNRARAHKAAKATPDPSELSNPLDTAEPLPSPRRNPRRSPRKALLELDRNSPSPTKSRDMTSRPNTPPSKADKHVNFNDADNNNNEDAAPTEPISCRRSARTRLPTPAANKTQNQIGAPSFIPLLRRGIEGGIEPLVLQKSEAQELAITTRANTRRNKGGAKRPALTLQTLTVETSPAVKERGRNGTKGKECKQVEWDEQLVYFQDAVAAAAAAAASDGTKTPATKPPSSSTTTQPQPTDPDPAPTRPAPKLRRLKPPGLPIPPTGTPAPKPRPKQNLESAPDGEVPKAPPIPKPARSAAASKKGVALRLDVGDGPRKVPAPAPRRKPKMR